MGPGTDEPLAKQCVDVIRHQLLASLFSGRARPGQRAPSVRRMAAMTGRSRKSIHEAYRVLASEGLLEARRGSGTFFPETSGSASAGEVVPAVSEAAAAARSCAELAQRLGVGEQDFARFFAHYVGFGFGTLRLAIVECNGEQLALMSEEIQSALGVRTRELMLEDLSGCRHLRLSDLRAVVTTICHANEVAEAVRDVGIPVYTVAMSADFLAPILVSARTQHTLLVVRDMRYEGVLRGYLERAGHARDLIDRLHFSLRDRLFETLGALPDHGSLWVPASIGPGLAAEGIDGWEVCTMPPFVDPASLERLRVELALRLSLSR